MTATLSKTYNFSPTYFNNYKHQWVHFVLKVLFMESGAWPTHFCDVTVCEQQQGERMHSRRVSDENIPIGLDSAEEGQPAIGKLFLSSLKKTKNKKSLQTQ